MESSRRCNQWCLLRGDTHTTHPNKGEKCRIFRFEKIDEEITEEMLSSKDKDTILKCISAGVLPKILQRDDVEFEVLKRREQGSSLYLDKENGKIVSHAEMKELDGLVTALIEVKRDQPLQPYFERNIEKGIVICPMGQTLFYAGPGQPNGKKDTTIRRYHRLSACSKCTINAHWEKDGLSHSKKVKLANTKIFTTKPEKTGLSVKQTIDLK